MDCVIVIRNYHWLNSASRVLITTCSAPLVFKRDSVNNFNCLTLTYNPRLANVKVDPHTKNHGRRSNGSNSTVPTDKRTDTHMDATKRIISPATWSIIPSNDNYIKNKTISFVQKTNGSAHSQRY